MIYGNMVGGASQVKTYLLEFEDGTTVPAVLVDSETIFTATENDIREGYTAVTDSGVTTGTKFIPPYFTSVGSRLITDAREFIIPLSKRAAYDYTAIQCIICPYNNSIADSVAADKIVIGDNVYATGSTEVLSVLTKDSDNESVNLGITNDSGIDYIMRYFTYKEEA